MSASLFFNYTWAIPFKNQHTTISVVDKNPAEARRTIAAYIASSQKTHKRIDITGINNKHGRGCVEDLETDLRCKLQILSDLVSSGFMDETLSARIDELLVSTEPISAEPANEPRFSWECDPKICRV
jgi:hypothetical protein